MEENITVSHFRCDGDGNGEGDDDDDSSGGGWGDRGDEGLQGL